MKTPIDRATNDPRWENATPKEAQDILKEYQEYASWYDYDDWAHSGLDNPHENN